MGILCALFADIVRGRCVHSNFTTIFQSFDIARTFFGILHRHGFNDDNAVDNNSRALFPRLRSADIALFHCRAANCVACSVAQHGAQGNKSKVHRNHTRHSAFCVCGSRCNGCGVGRGISCWRHDFEAHSEICHGSSLLLRHNAFCPRRDISRKRGFPFEKVQEGIKKPFASPSGKRISCP